MFWHQWVINEAGTDNIELGDVTCSGQKLARSTTWKKMKMQAKDTDLQPGKVQTNQDSKKV